MVLNIIFYLCFLISSQEEIPNLIKILLYKSSKNYFYFNASFDKDNTIILPLKIELNSLTTSIFCENLKTFSEDNILTCEQSLCYKLFYNEEICDESSDNKCSFLESYKYDFEQSKNISGNYIINYFKIFINDTNYKEKNNILPIGCIENNFNIVNENITFGIFSLGGSIYSFLPLFYKENNFQVNNSFFSICLDPEEGGYLSFGNIIDKYHLNNDLPLHFNYDIKDSYFIFKINNMFFNHNNFNKEEYEAIFNIDLQYSYVNKEIVNNLNALFENYLTKDLLKKYQLDLTINNNDLDVYGICFINNNKKDIQFKNKLIAIFPPLFIGIQYKYYKWNSEYYLYKKNNIENEEYCIGLLSNEKRINDENGEIFEFGANFMYGHELVFNYTKKEIIVYESNCAMKPKKKIDIKLDSKYEKMNIYLKVVIIFLAIVLFFFIFAVCRLSKKRSPLCIKLFGKQITNEEINQFFNSNYNVIK